MDDFEIDLALERPVGRGGWPLATAGGTAGGGATLGDVRPDSGSACVETEPLLLSLFLHNLRILFIPMIDAVLFCCCCAAAFAASSDDMESMEKRLEGVCDGGRESSVTGIVSEELLSGGLGTRDCRVGMLSSPNDCESLSFCKREASASEG